MILNQRKETKTDLPDIAGHSPLITQINNKILELAQSDENIIVSGEMGTGKKMIAQKIHALSKTANQPFLFIKCNQINAIENISLIEQSTLFLDEITEMPLSIQIKLLRGLQEKKQHSIRIIASTSKSLEKAIHAGQFKEDLYYRLQAFTLHIPPLRERIDDLGSLISSLSEILKVKIHFSTEAFKQLQSYAWPGNITELENLLKQLSVSSPEKEIYIEYLPLSSSKSKQFEQVILSNSHHTAKLTDIHSELPPLSTEGVDLKMLLQTLEENYIQQALLMTQGVVSHAAELLKIKRTTLVEKIKKYQLLSHL